MHAGAKGLIAVCLVTASFGPARPCTTFCLVERGQVLFGKNYDWDVGRGLLVVNKRDVERAAAPPQTGAAARWTSRFGSVTFNQYGRGSPSGGINEAGLAIELMWLEGTRYPSPDDRPAVGVLEWIQYQLDLAAGVPDVIASDRAVRISGGAPLHYLVADREGRVAAVEFLGGRMEVHTGAGLPARALANSTYRESIEHLRLTRGPDREAGAGRDSLSRFARAARRASEYRRDAAADGVGYAFETLRQVSSHRTQWSIVYDLPGRRVHFRTRGRPPIRTLGLAGLEFDCSTPVQILDLDAPVEGDVAGRLGPYSLEANLDLVRAAYAGTPFLSGETEEKIHAVARRPEAERCRAGAGSR